MSGKYALIIGNSEYIDPGLAQLTAPGKDAEDFARVLKDKEIGAFDDVNILLNQPEPVVRGAIDEFFDQKKPDDLLVLYFSGHGIRDELGALFLAVKNTIRSRLRSTAVKSDYIREAMDQSRSKRQVLILDCCNSGAFPHGTKSATGVSIGTATAFEAGYGRIVLTASDSTQFAWEGDKVIGETDNSLFTHYLIEGLKGDADNDGDGRITVDELYDYAYEKVRLATPKQTPSKFSSNQQGEIVLRQNIRIEDLKPTSLPPYLISAIESPDPNIRLGAVQSLAKMLAGKNIGLVHSAKEALGRIANEDDSRQVSRVAMQAMESANQAEQLAIQKKFDNQKKDGEEENKVSEEMQRLAIQRTEEFRLMREKAKADHKAIDKIPFSIAQNEEKRFATEKSNPISKLPGNPTTALSFFLSWRGRMLLGAILLNLIFPITLILTVGWREFWDRNGITFRLISEEVFLFIVGTSILGGASGLIFYPNKFSILCLLIGVVIVDIIYYGTTFSPYNAPPEEVLLNIILVGVFLGVLPGSLVSRILHWLKILK